MDFAWILLGIAAWAIGIFIVFVVMHVSGDQEDRAFRSELGMRADADAPGIHEQSGDRS